MAAGELDEIFTALSHGLRRRIIALLAGSPNGLSYSELLRNTGVESSMLSFHLKKLKHLVERGDDGLYRLTGLGVKAASVLSCVQGDGGGGGFTVSGIPVFVVGDDVLLEAYRRGGLEIEDAGAVIILESSRSLFKKAVKAIRRTVVVYTPAGLLEAVEARVSGIGAIIPYRGKPPVPVDRPDAIVGDLYRRGYRAVAERLKATLGSS
ncbi:MAG: helix-turn-helix domain-containing protein [Desulfurococcales archaeon]|nr:helix-turn-helix domain-containing protein [Desulfurococcales archaeon]